MSDDPSSRSPGLHVAVIAAGDWRVRLPDAEAVAERAAEATWAAAPAARGLAERLARPLEISLVLSDDATVRRLNRDFRGRDRATNVLSFVNLEPTDEAAPESPADEPLVLGDVVLALETVEREAEGQGKQLGHHLSHLVVHGVLHLLGYDHAEAADAEAMERCEIEVLAGLGIPDPYADGPPVLARGGGGGRR